MIGNILSLDRASAAGRSNQSGQGITQERHLDNDAADLRNSICRSSPALRSPAWPTAGSSRQPSAPANGTVVTLAQPASALTVGLAFEAQITKHLLGRWRDRPCRGSAESRRGDGPRRTIRGFPDRRQPAGRIRAESSQELRAALAKTWSMPDPRRRAPFNSQATPLFTGDIRIPSPPGTTPGPGAVQQLNPLPLQVLDFVPEVQRRR